MATLSAITSLPAETHDKLKRAGILSTDALVMRCSTAENRRYVASLSGLTEPELFVIAQACELFRLKRVGVQSYELMLLLGIKSLPQLAASRHEDLYAMIIALPPEQTLGRQLPRVETLQDWVQNARALTSRVR